MTGHLQMAWSQFLSLLGINLWQRPLLPHGFHHRCPLHFPAFHNAHNSGVKPQNLKHKHMVTEYLDQIRKHGLGSCDFWHLILQFLFSLINYHLHCRKRRTSKYCNPIQGHTSLMRSPTIQRKHLCASHLTIRTGDKERDLSDFFHTCNCF
jgi:hypothetical protein